MKDAITAKKVALRCAGAEFAIHASIGTIDTWPSGDSSAVLAMAMKRASTTPPVCAAVHSCRPWNMPMIGSDSSVVARVRKITMSAIDFSAMKRRNRNRPASVSALVMRSSRDRKLWSKPSSSIIHQLAPAPGPGRARKAKMMMTVPRRVRAASGESSRSRRVIMNPMIANEVAKMISWPYSMPDSPTLMVSATNTALPPRIHQLGAVFSSGSWSRRSISARLRPSAASRFASRRLRKPPSSTPLTDSSGMISASS